MRIDISELGETFPDFEVAVISCSNLTVEDQRCEELHDLIVSREEEVRRRWAGVAMGDIPGIKVWQDAYRRIGIKRGNYHSSVERLLRDCVNERELPATNAVIDVHSVISLTHVLPLGASDASFLQGGLSYRYACEGDTFRDMDDRGEPADNPPKDGEVVLADEAKVLCRRWNWRQDPRSLVSGATKDAVVVVEDNGCGTVQPAVDDLVELLEYFCQARTAVTMATADQPSLDLRQPALA